MNPLPGPGIAERSLERVEGDACIPGRRARELKDVDARGKRPLKEAAFRVRRDDQFGAAEPGRRLARQL